MAKSQGKTDKNVIMYKHFNINLSNLCSMQKIITKVKRTI